MKMKMRTQKTFTFLLLLSFIFAHVSESAIFSENVIALFKKFPRNSLTKLQRGNIDYEKAIEFLKKSKEHIDNFPDYLDALQLLQSYGFINSSLLQPNSPDILDDTYYSYAVWRIQKNFNLQPTGKLDPDTINIILKPRCDFPNKIHGTSTLTKLVNKQISLKPWWRNVKKNNLTYAFGNDVPVMVNSLFQAVFNRWSNLGALKFTETKSFKDSDILVAFVQADEKGGVVGSWGCIFG